jgi:hypothetical protein
MLQASAVVAVRIQIAVAGDTPLLLHLEIVDLGQEFRAELDHPASLADPALPVLGGVDQVVEQFFNSLSRADHERKEVGRRGCSRRGLPSIGIERRT